MHKVECFTTGGILKEYLQGLEAETEDLIGESELPEGEDEAKLYFGWRRSEKKYRMVGQE